MHILFQILMWIVMKQWLVLFGVGVNILHWKRMIVVTIRVYSPTCDYSVQLGDLSQCGEDGITCTNSLRCFYILPANSWYNMVVYYNDTAYQVCLYQDIRTSTTNQASPFNLYQWDSTNPHTNDPCIFLMVAMIIYYALPHLSLSLSSTLKRGHLIIGAWERIGGKKDKHSSGS